MTAVDLEIEGTEIVYTDGIYDAFHFGHTKSLEQAKKSFPNTYLLVSCCNDEITHKFKGLRHCKWVDEVIPDAPWALSPEFLDKHKIDYVAHDSLPYADASGVVGGNDVYDFVKSIGKFKETKRTDGILTSDIIMRIVKDYNHYVIRNLDRGYFRKELGLSFVRGKRLRVNMRFRKISEKVGVKILTVAKTTEMHWIEWVENVNRRGKCWAEDLIQLCTTDDGKRTIIREFFFLQKTNQQF